MPRICAVLLLIALLPGAAAAADEPPAAAPAKPLTPDARRLAFQAVQKELEPLRPAPGASKEEINSYLELAMESYGKFARENPKTPEGFEAASLIALVLLQANHPRADEFILLAATTAPEAGVDVKRVALFWGLVADSRHRANDIPGARAALERIKTLDKETYEQLTARFEDVLKEDAKAEQAPRKNGQ